MRRNALLLLWALFAFAAFTGISHADGRRGFHQKVYVVPAPGKVTIDGKLDDWDLSGQITISVSDETSAMQSARFAMMYDKNALYVSGVVRDPTPMLNRHDPLVDPGRGWDGDACQIYLTTDTKLGYPIHKGGADTVPGTMDMYLWRFTDRKEPALACFQGMQWTSLHPEWDAKGAIPSNKFQAAYVLAPDGKGYTFEYSIPWSVLGATKPLKGGDLTAGLVQFDWSDSTGLNTGGGASWAYDVMGRPGFPWQDSGCWGKVIFSDKGHLSSDLVEEGLPPAKPLPLTYEYDLPADGDTTIQFFGQDGVLARTLVAAAPRHAGHNVESWDGLDANGVPMKPGKYVWKGLYHDPITTKFLFSAHNSGQPPYHTDDGTGSWGGDHGNPTSTCAADDGIIMGWQMSESGFGIIKTDFSGKKIWGSKHNASDIATDNNRLFVVGDFGSDGFNAPKVFDAKNCRPLDWGNGKLTLDAPANAKPGDNIATAIAYSAGKVYASWPLCNAVCVYDSVSGAMLDTIPVPDAAHLAVESDGTILVVSQGKVLSLTGHTSKVLIDSHVDLSHRAASTAVIFDGRNGIAVGPDGTIYVANNGAMQDVSAFDSHGTFLRTIGKPGGRPAMGHYDRTGIYEPSGITVDKLGHLWVAEATDYPKRISEWDTKTGDFVNEFFGGASYFGWAYMDPRHPNELYCHNVIWHVDWKNNTCTPYSTIWRPSAPNQIVNYNPAGYNGQMRVYTLKDGSQAAFGYTNFQQIRYPKRVGDLFLPYAARINLASVGEYAVGPEYDIMKDSKTYPDGVYYWIDSNGDQRIQADELSTGSSKWDEAMKQLRDSLSTPSDIDASTIGFNSVPNLVRYGPAPDGSAGKFTWAYRGGLVWNSAIDRPPLTPGDMIGLTMPLGVAGGFTGAASYFGVFQIVTTDGVYVGQLFRDTRLGGGLGPDTLCSETLIGQMVKPDGMNRTFLLGGAADGRVSEVLGLDTVKRLPGGEFDFTQEDADKAAAARAAYMVKLEKAQHLTVARGLPLIDTAKSVGKSITPQRSFTARAAYDATNLYIRYSVISESELTNSISDPHLIFKGGNLMDIQIATNPAADPARKAAAVGDVRILVTRQNGKTVAIMYRPKVAGFTGQPIVLKSPANQQAFDSIEPVDVGLDYQMAPNSFTATVTIPLKLLGMTIKPGQVIKMDLGYIFGDPAGNQTSAREYWSNNGFSANVVNDVPNESVLEPQQWGTAVAE